MIDGAPRRNAAATHVYNWFDAFGVDDARSSRCAGDAATDAQIPCDDQGHGSHTASTVAGNTWNATFSSGAFTISGVAPHANVISYLACPTTCPTTATTASVNQAVIDGVRAHQIPAVFCESTVSSKPAEQVARETGAAFGGILYVDSLSETDGPVPTYLDLLKVTTETIARGLTPAN